MGTLSILTSTIGSHQGSGSTLVFDESFITGLGNSVTFVRATTATVEVSDGTIDDVAVNEARFQGSTHNGENDWTAHANSDGLLIEEARTNRADNADALASPDTIDLTADGTGDFTLSVSGTAAVTVAEGTATGTGYGQATAGSPVTFNLTVTGTVTLTLDSGALTQNANGSYEYNLEAGSFATTWIPNTIAGTTRDKEECAISITIKTNDITIAYDWTPREDSGTTVFFPVASYSDGGNLLYFRYSSGAMRFRKRIAGSNYDSTKTLNYTIGTTYRIVGRVSSTTGVTLWIDGAISSSNGNTDDAVVGTSLELGASNGSGQTTMNIANFLYYEEAKSDADCAAL